MRAMMILNFQRLFVEKLSVGFFQQPISIKIVPGSALYPTIFSESHLWPVSFRGFSHHPMRDDHRIKSIQVRGGIKRRVSVSVSSSVADPNPDPDPHLFGPPGSGSGSTSQRHGSGSCCRSGSGSFYHHAKIVRKTLIPTILLLFLTFYLWKMM
jgi:hypothetical protein